MQEKRFQNRIRLFTYALTILVIWVHSVNLTPELSFSGSALCRSAYALERFFTDTLGQTAVPGFFMVSAYLFFRKLPGGTDLCLSPGWVLQKWKRRFFSLLLPFVLWNLLYYLLHLLAGGAELLLGLPRTEQVPFDLRTVFSAAFLYTYNPVFWYLYQLILLTLLAPFLFYLVRGRKTGFLFLLLSFFSAVFWERIPFHLVNEDALFYYLLGLYGSLHKKELMETGKHADRALLVMIVLLILWGIIFQAGILPAGLLTLPEAVIARSVSFRAVVPLLLYFLLTRLTEQGTGKLPGFMEISFFIYATHYLVVKTVNRLMTAVLSVSPTEGASLPNGGILLLLLTYFLLPIICTAAAYVGSRVMKRRVPGVWKLLSGGR